ncbi:hypothetical protein HNY73_022400 [Argiope bruennichi]|uniref:Uncharacterized protein n=1 Tax=Argiope bruennichi TaxID=94029 RepID=A0A8T0E2C4_ARGBR|nr:hypothetical protein HNY73_022400 [Argiope bruennichi]
MLASEGRDELYQGQRQLGEVIACKPVATPYIHALLFTDQLFNEKETENTNKSASPTYGIAFEARISLHVHTLNNLGTVK